MNFGIRFRLIALGLAAGLMGLLIVLIMLNSQRQVSELRSQLGKTDSESSGMMDQFKDSLRKLNSAVLRYGAEHDPLAWQESLKADHELEVWINSQKTALHTPAEMDLLRQIQEAHVNYVQIVRNFHNRVESLDGKSASLADFSPVRKQSQLLFDLGQSLARTHHQANNQPLQHANRALEQLNISVLVLLGLLFVSGIAMAAVVYLHLIAPLRVKLVETQAFADRHEKLASLGLLASGVAHEIRNPLNSIKIGMFFQKEKFPPGTPQRADAEVVEREILRLEHILDEFLAFTRPTLPKLVPVQLDVFLHELRQFFTPQLAAAKIRLVLQILAPMQVRADAAQLKQAIINLVQNAMNSIGSDGQITLHVRADRKVLTGKEAAVAVIEIADTGKGIPPEVERHLFQPFFTTKKDGAGLGLPIAAQIVRNHGGELQYQTQINHGTRFSIILPQLTA
jgi:signal transduction histidine kinase